MLNIKLISWALGLWGAVTFVVCVIYGLVTPQSLHMHTFLEQVLPAFKWLTWWGFTHGVRVEIHLDFFDCRQDAQLPYAGAVCERLFHGHRALGAAQSIDLQFKRRRGLPHIGGGLRRHRRIEWRSMMFRMGRRCVGGGTASGHYRSTSMSLSTAS